MLTSKMTKYAFLMGVVWLECCRYIVAFQCGTHHHTAAAPTRKSSHSVFAMIPITTTTEIPFLLEVDPSMVTPQRSMSSVATVTESPLQLGVVGYMSSSVDSPPSVLKLNSMTVALQERKIPTSEEIAAKKNTFNLIFWVSE